MQIRIYRIDALDPISLGRDVTIVVFEKRDRHRIGVTNNCVTVDSTTRKTFLYVGLNTVSSGVSRVQILPRPSGPRGRTLSTKLEVLLTLLHIALRKTHCIEQANC